MSRRSSALAIARTEYNLHEHRLVGYEYYAGIKTDNLRVLLYYRRLTLSSTEDSMAITIETIRNNRRITIKRIRAQFTRVLPCKVWIAYHQEQSNQGPNSRAPQQSMLICVGP